MKKKSRLGFTILLIIATVFLVFTSAFAVTDTPIDKRKDWWRDARFGMFIHFGLYSIPAGEWNGETSRYIAEWLMYHLQIPIEEYETLVPKFNPTNFNADEIVRMAKNAGMKYIVITTKHHDGFCLYDSKYTDYDVMSSPYNKDLMDEMAQACRKYGLKMCWYYSIMDWHHNDYLPRREWDNDRPAETADYDRYVTYMKNQLEELLTNYGDIGVIWFDGGWEDPWTQDRGRDLYEYLRELSPDILVNNRCSREHYVKEDHLAPFRVGDFNTPEQVIPAQGLEGIDWETCMTMNRTWGYKKTDHNWKSSTSLLKRLVDITSKGGNYLLNIGPDGSGAVPEPSIERLAEIGTWMKANGESIYGTTASPFEHLPWGRCTVKKNEKSTTLYLHIFDWPENNLLQLPGLQNKIKNAYLLEHSDKKIKTRSIKGNKYIELPEGNDFHNNHISVIKMQIKGAPIVSTYTNMENVSGTIQLSPMIADIIGSSVGLYYDGNHGFLYGFECKYDWAEWKLDIRDNGTYNITIEYTVDNPGNSLQIYINNSSDIVTLDSTESKDDYSSFEMKDVKLECNKKNKIAIRSYDFTKDSDLRISRIILKRVKD